MPLDSCACAKNKHNATMECGRDILVHLRRKFKLSAGPEARKGCPTSSTFPPRSSAVAGYPASLQLWRVHPVQTQHVSAPGRGSYLLGLMPASGRIDTAETVRMCLCPVPLASLPAVLPVRGGGCRQGCQRYGSLSRITLRVPSGQASPSFRVGKPMEASLRLRYAALRAGSTMGADRDHCGPCFDAARSVTTPYSGRGVGNVITKPANRCRGWGSGRAEARLSSSHTTSDSERPSIPRKRYPLDTAFAVPKERLIPHSRYAGAWPSPDPTAGFSTSFRSFSTEATGHNQTGGLGAPLRICWRTGAHDDQMATPGSCIK